MNIFGRLIQELGEYQDKGYSPEIEAIKLHAAARGDTRVGVQNRQAMKALLADPETLTKALNPARPTVIFIPKDAFTKPTGISETIAKAFAALNSDQIAPSQRGAIMLRLSELAEGVAAQTTFAKALRAAEPRSQRADADEELATPQSARTLTSRLKEIEAHLDRHADASHHEAAAKLMASAQKMLENPESMSMGDHACLRIMLDGLRQKIQEGRDARR